jgi:glucose-6-phosphate 1-dehydrogenase
MTARAGAASPGNHVIVLCGATGDLAGRKLLPGLFHLAAAAALFLAPPDPGGQAGTEG